MVEDLKQIASSPEFKKVKEILKENQRLMNRTDPDRERKNAGYKALEEILSKVSNEKGR